ncbi:unnamed protein product [Phyllotreta striolata]|uniref:Anaphase-promoting complex subunit 1 n=1 Tax=Phyllotreta striolata TaxID=444603 RepID=A0A9N9XIU3_PHYSR|nr:unnamed protein product [Phyllotreta striolata]
MIAASDPQEYVPSGRQQALRHPGPMEASIKTDIPEIDDPILNKLESVSLTDSKKTEWWTLRKVQELKQYCQETKEPDRIENKSFMTSNYRRRYSDISDDSFSLKSNVDVSLNKFGKRLSDVNSSKFSNKRLSVDNEPRDKSDGCFLSQRTGECNFKTKKNATYMEDELYVNGYTVTWSRGLVNSYDDLDNGRKTICSYTSDFVIKQALWCTFYCECPVFHENSMNFVNCNESTGTPIESVCITDSHTIQVFTPKGEDFTVSVPFILNKIWNTKFGILLSKESGGFPKDYLYEMKGTLYSLAYPLDDVCPVVVNQNGYLSILNNSSVQVVFTSVNPSICMVFDTATKQHSVYRIRKLRPNEYDAGDKLSSMCANQSIKLKNKLSMWENVNSRILPPTSITTISNTAHFPNNRSQTSMAMVSRCQSPAPSSYSSPWVQRNSQMYSSIKNSEINKSYFDLSKTASFLRANPSLCLDYLWTDNYSFQDTNIAAPATKVFFTEDFVGQKYLCYVLDTRSQLSIVKVDYSGRNFTFGVLTSISAKDAASIPHLRMLAILEHSGNVTLYSGLNVIGKLHIGGTLAQHAPSPYIRRAAYSPYPRRSTLLPHLKPGDLKFDEHLLSPVLPAISRVGSRSSILHLSYTEHDNKKVVLSNLMDAIEDRLTLKYTDGTCYRITLPSISSTSLVDSCLIALRQILPKDIAAVLLCRWYATKNVIGAQDTTFEQEWNMFALLLFELLGYDYDQISDGSSEPPITPSSLSKKQKYSSGTDQDWSYLLSSDHTKCNENLIATLKIGNPPDSSKNERGFEGMIDTGGVLFPYIRQIHFSFHLLYEDIKLNVFRSEELLPLMKFLNRLSLDLDLKEYSLHYWLDFPEHAVIEAKPAIPDNELKNIAVWPGFSQMPYSVFRSIYNMLDESYFQPYPYLPNVNSRSRDILELCGIVTESDNSHSMSEVDLNSFVKEIDCTTLKDLPQSACNQKKLSNNVPAAAQLILLMVEKNITTSYLDTLPYSIFYLLYNTLWKCRENPPADWPPEAYYLIWREDLAAAAVKIKKEKQEYSQELLGMCSNTQLEDVMPGIKADFEQTDGMEDIDNSLMKLRFSDDVRVNEARKMLQSSRPVSIVLTQRPDVSDHDFIEEQEKHLYGLCIRTMALPVGRGMFTLRTARPVITEPLPAPLLCLTGKAPPRGTTVDLSHIDTPANMHLWPLFHNGVANGLRITPDAHNIDNKWITFNTNKGGTDLQMEHAGFLLALGLNGHLKNLAFDSTFNYLEKFHEMTSVGVLLGLSAAFRGTAHPSLTKTLAIHVEALLPPTSMELDIPQTLQVAGLLGVGLVYEGTAHRHMTEVLLTEIGRPPGPEMENSIDRESYSLSAGLALGLVTLKQGDRPSGLSDLNVPDMLHYYMVGGNKRPLTGSQKDKYKTASFQIREGTSVNLDVTAPGATLALGLMYLGTNNKAVADWMAPPQTQYLLDFVRPDFLLLRTLSRSLILWNDVEPTKEWVENQIPSTIRPYCMVNPTHNLNIDYEAMNQAYCNIVAGASFALGLKFAGTANEEAYETLLHFCNMFTSLNGKPVADLAGKSTIETCLNVLLLSVSMVMAGTGDLEIIRLVRHLRRRVGVSNSQVVTYGSHLAIHMALGLLFLGGGKYTLSNTPSSVAALICAFYPKFPTHSNDNRYHLQAFRHLYVLAVEPRLIIPKEVHADEICYANLRVVQLDGTEVNIKGPGIIPDLNTLRKVEVKDERYWPVTFERGKNWESLERILSTTGYVEVKQRAGCLSYILDKFGYRSQLARTLTHSAIVPWDPSPTSITLFTSDQCVKLFCEHFLGCDKSKETTALEARLKQCLTKITYDAVVHDKLIVIVVFISMLKAILDLNDTPSPLNALQFKIIAKQILRNRSFDLLSKEVVLALRQEYLKYFDDWEEILKPQLQSFLSNRDFNKDTSNLDCKRLATYVVFYDFPWNCRINRGEYLEMLGKLPSNLCTNTVDKIIKIFS